MPSAPSGGPSRPAARADPLRALVVTNMWPSPAAPALGAFVRDQVDALRRIDGVEVEVEAFAPGSAAAYARAASDVRRRRGPSVAGRFDVVHAHFGLTAWVARALAGAPRALTLHGTDVHHPRTRALTLAALGGIDLVAAASQPLADDLPARVRARGVTVLPCGVALDRFRPIPRSEARAALGLPAREPCLLFPADPARAGKRHDRALLAADGARLLHLGAVEPAAVPLWVNAANAVVLPSASEGFGLAVLEALACDVPVLATPTGIHAEALAGIDGTLCAPWEEDAWRAAARAALADDDPRVVGRASAARWSSDAMAEQVAAAWRELVRSA